MTYKGYRINVYWTDKDWGYRFTVYDPEGKVASAYDSLTKEVLADGQ